MTKHKHTSGPVLIILAGIFWGSMSIFVRRLTALGFTSAQIAAARLVLGAVIFAALLLIKDRPGFRLKPRDIPLFLGLGLGSVLFFTVCYFAALTILPISTAAILLYTSPIWIMLMSALFFREKITGRKIAALILAFAGCALVSGISGEGVSAKGVILGLCSGLGYALYSILGTVALRRYSSYTVTTYTFIFAAAGSLAVCDLPDMLTKLTKAENLPFILLLFLLTAAVTAVIPYLLYTLGLSHVEAGRAGILAAVEPVAATLFGILIFREKPTLLSALGILLVLAAIVVLNLKRKADS